MPDDLNDPAQPRNEAPTLCPGAAVRVYLTAHSGTTLGHEGTVVGKDSEVLTVEIRSTYMGPVQGSLPCRPSIVAWPWQRIRFVEIAP
jgi:hypothetical protein